MTTQVVGIAGWKNSGKTTLAVNLIAELTRRGYRVASIKHAHHDADIDHEGTDTFRHRAAGAAEVVLVTGRRWAVIHELRGDAEPTLAETMSRLSPADIVIVEGYKRERNSEDRSAPTGGSSDRPDGAGRSQHHSDCGRPSV